jgi:hypothetical protein
MSQDTTQSKSVLGGVQLKHQGLGRLVMQTSADQPTVAVLPVRAFPLQAPDEGIALVSEAGAELLWIDHLDDLNAQSRQSLVAALAEREFIPEILRLVSVSTPSTPSVWRVETDRGPAELILKGEEDLRVLPGPRPRLLITSGHGLIYSIRDLGALDRKSKKLLERFL